MSPLEFSKTSDTQHEHLSVLLTGPGGIGKTTLVKSLKLSADSKLLYIGVDPGQLALRDRDFIIAQADKWDEAALTDLYIHCRDNAKNYEWIVIDGLDEIGDSILHAMKSTAKDMRKAYGEMADLCERWTKAMRDIKGVNVIFISHLEEKQDDMGRMYWRPSFPGNQFTAKLPNLFDLVGCMRLVETDEGKRRMIQFQLEADERYVVKDRSGVLDPLEVPDLSAIFEKIHGKTKKGSK